MGENNIYDDLYFRYYNLGSRSFYDKIYFYEYYIASNDLLLYEEKFDLTLDYVQAIYEIGKYAKFLDLIDPIIETVIKENILFINDQDIFQKLLFKKASAFYRLGLYVQSIFISKQLMAINDKNFHYKLLYCKAFLLLWLGKNRMSL